MPGRGRRLRAAPVGQHTRGPPDAAVLFDETTIFGQTSVNYLRGNGPPAWAVWVSEILGYIGIGISAWAVVAVIAGLVVTIVLVCAAHILPDSLQNLCDRLPSFSFVQP